MTARAKKFLLKPLALLLVGLSLEGCVGLSADDTGRYVAPIGGAPVISNETPYSQALRCMASFTKSRPVKLTVVGIQDYTGKNDSDGSGRALTQGGSLMVISALSKAGVHQVERFDTSGFEMDLKYANNKLISEQDKDGSNDYRKIQAGSVSGADYYIAGGITQLDLNVGSMGMNGTEGQTAAVGIKGTAGANVYVMNVAVDLRLIDSRTTDIVDTVSFQKQIIGRQISAGVFDFLGGEFFDASFGGSALEPKNLAVRSVIERSLLEMMQRLYRLPAGTCQLAVDPLDDRQNQAGYQPQYPQPYQAPYQQPYQPQYQQPYPPQYQPSNYQPMPQENTNAQTRQDPYRFYGNSDPASSSLRGRN